MKQLHIHLNRILQSILHIHNYTRWIDQDSFDTNQMIFDAVCMQLINAGEQIILIQSSDTPMMHDELMEKFSKLSWIINHPYFSANKDLIREYINQELDPLKHLIQDILEQA
jgi:uncharacterized protein with HEPN domain